MPIVFLHQLSSDMVSASYEKIDSSPRPLLGRGGEGAEKPYAGKSLGETNESDVAIKREEERTSLPQSWF